MNVIRAAADTFRRDRLGACGNDYIKTPALDGLARGGTLFARPDNLDGRSLPPAMRDPLSVAAGRAQDPPPADSVHGGNGRGAESH